MKLADLQYKGRVNIRNAATNKYISLANKSKEKGVKVIQSHDARDFASIWDLFWDPKAPQRNDAWEGLYFRSVHTYYWLNLTGGVDHKKPTQIIVWDLDDACRWRLTRQPEEYNKYPPRGRIQSMMSWDVLNVREESFDDGAEIIAWDDNDDEVNTWELDYVLKIDESDNLLDVWGEGRIKTQEGLITGFHEAINLNHRNQTVFDGDNKGKPIPRLFAVDNYDNPKFPDKKFKYVTLMGAPITPGTAQGMCDVLSRDGYIYLYMPTKNRATKNRATEDMATKGIDYPSIFEEVALNSGIKRIKVVHPSKLKSPFNQISGKPFESVFVYSYSDHPAHDEF